MSTWWKVHTLPRTDGTTATLYLSTPSDDAEEVAKITKAAEAAGMLITRCVDPAEKNPIF